MVRLAKFRNRHDLKFKSISGEEGSVDHENVKIFLEKILLLLEGYDAKNAFNADETGHFYRASPDRTLAFKREKSTGEKMVKERLKIS